MKPLDNLLNFDQYVTLMSEGKKVIEQILEDRTTTKDNLREKVRNYALNYIAITPELSGIDKDKLIEDLADEIEDELKGYSFFQQPPAALIAQRERGKIPEDPEKRFIKLRP